MTKAERSKKWREENPEKVKEYNRILREKYNANKKCSYCGCKISSSKKYQTHCEICFKKREKEKEEKRNELNTKRREKYKSETKVFCRSCDSEILNRTYGKIYCDNCTPSSKTKEYNRKYNRNWYNNRKEKCRESARKYYIKNREKHLLRKKIWRKNNPEKVKEKNARHEKKRRSDPIYRFQKSCSISVWLSMRGKKENKKTEEALIKHCNYDFTTLRKHIERQFDKKMSWENYGSYWHLDHIIPRSKLPFESFEDPNFRKLWALGNLRPLEAKENISKNNKIVNGLNQLKIF